MGKSLTQACESCSCEDISNSDEAHQVINAEPSATTLAAMDRLTTTKAEQRNEAISDSMEKASENGVPKRPVSIRGEVRGKVEENLEDERMQKRFGLGRFAKHSKEEQDLRNATLQAKLDREEANMRLPENPTLGGASQKKREKLEAMLGTGPSNSMPKVSRKELNARNRTIQERLDKEAIRGFPEVPGNIGMASKILGN